VSSELCAQWRSQDMGYKLGSAEAKLLLIDHLWRVGRGLIEES
jgi:hypothetical protein